MLAETPTLAPLSKTAFPLAAVQERLRRELEEAAAESKILHPGWEPVLDSLRMVTVVAALEELIKFPLPPEKVIKRGGYRSVEEGTAEMAEKVRRIWNDRQQKGG